MNQYQHKPMPYGAKMAKLLASQFYLSQEDTDTARQAMEDKSIRNERDLIQFIDDHGEWLDG